MSTKYRIYCNTEDSFQYEWTDTPPTVCPNNASHEVNIDSVSIAGYEKLILHVTPYITRTNRSDYTRIATITVDPTTIGTLRRIKVVSYGDDSAVTSYDIEVFNRDTKETIVSGTFSNYGDVQLNDLGVVTDTPTEINVLEVNAKRTCNNSQKYLNVIEIQLFQERLR